LVDNTFLVYYEEMLFFHGSNDGARQNPAVSLVPCASCVCVYYFQQCDITGSRYPPATDTRRTIYTAGMSVINFSDLFYVPEKLESDSVHHGRPVYCAMGR
jgi:hypothetical protein